MPAPGNTPLEDRIRHSFARQLFMTTLGARINSIAPGEVVLELPFRADLTQQHGFLHAGVVAAVADSACGYAALSMMPVGVAVLSVEFKINMMKPAAGTTFHAVGRVVRAGQTLTVCSGEVRALSDGTESLIALMQATMMTVRQQGVLAD